MIEPCEKLVLRSALAPSFTVLQAFGYWPPEEPSRKVAIFYKIYATIFLGFILILFTLSELINVLLSLDDIEKITEASVLFLTHFVQLIKFYHFVKYNQRIKDLANSLQRTSFMARNQRQYKVLSKCIFLAQFISYLFIVLVLGSSLLWSALPFIERIDGKMSLPFRSYTPFATDTSPAFEIMYFFQFFAATVNGVANACMDTTVTTLMLLMCGELDLLNDTLIHIKEFAVQKLRQLNASFDWNEKSHNDVPPVLQAEMHNILVECVHQHWHILDTTKEIGVLFNMLIFSQFSTSAIIICVTMFELTVAKLFSVQFMTMMLYQGCMVMEIMLYCWFGNEIILKSSNISSSVYSSDWYRCSIDYKKKLLFVMTRSKIPIRLFAGNVFTLSLLTFAAILKTSWSYFAVLRTVHTGKDK